MDCDRGNRSSKPAALLEVAAAAYEAGADRAEWSAFLALATNCLGATSGQLLTRRDDGSGWRIADVANLSSATVHAYNSHWAAHDEILRLAAGAPGAKPDVRAIDVAASPDPFCTYFLQPAGVRHLLTAATADHHGLALVFWRADDRPFSPRERQTLRRLWPHVVKARGWSHAPWRPDESASWFMRVLDLWHLGVVALSSSGRPLHANRTVARIAATDDGFSLASGGPVAADARMTSVLRGAVHRVAAGRPPTTEWLRLRRPSGARPYEIAVRRLAAEREEPAVLMVVADPDAPLAIDIEAVQRLHGLAPLEARVAASVTAGASVTEVMRRHELSMHTARWYVQRVREKLEVDRQQDLLRLIVRGVVGVAWDLDPVSGSDQTKISQLPPPK